MSLFYLRAFTAFLLVRVVSVCLHYLGPSPWGGPLVLSPDRFLPEALAIEIGIWGIFCLGLGALEMALRKPRTKSSYRALVVSLCAALAIFSQVDFEVVRWIGQHMSISYIQNFAGARDGKLFTRILSGDVLFSSLAAAQMLISVLLAGLLFFRFGREDKLLTRRGLWVSGFVTLLTLTSPLWFRPSEKRWRRIEPASIGVLLELKDAALGATLPKSEKRAHADLVSLIYRGRYDTGAAPIDPRYPLYRDDNVGRLEHEAFRAQPQQQKPDVVLLVFETMRGMNTGFLGEKRGATAAMPRVRALLEESGRYFPRMHSAGYPSVAGAMGMHLGIWPHHTRIVFSSYLHISSRGFPQMLGEAGYESLALLGADPSFSNFTPWFRRWYDSIEYSPKNNHDGPLVDRFISLYEERKTSEKPLLFTLWTATTHPPYDVPKESGTTPATTNEERYLQAMRYADGHLVRLIEHLKNSPRWERTLVFILGDHSQPTPYQWTHTNEVGELNPGHTWTSLGILGGSAVMPAPGRDERTVSHVDLPPTILSAINLKSKNHFFGRDLLKDQSERAVWAFRYGDISVEEGRVRQLFRISGEEGKAYEFLTEDPLSYGALEGGFRKQIPLTSDLTRHQDVALAFAQLLEENRLAPQEADSK